MNHNLLSTDIAINMLSKGLTFTIELLYLFVYIILLINFTRKIFKKRDLIKKPLFSPLITFFATLTYFLPLNQLIATYANRVKKIVFLPLIIKKKLAGNTGITILSQISIFKSASILISNYAPLFFLIFAYFFIVKERKFKVNYYIRFHTIHAILMLFIQIPLIFLNKNLLALPVGNSKVKFFIDKFVDTMILFNFYILFYLIFCSMSSIYSTIPILTPACEAHIGKNSEIK